MTAMYATIEKAVTSTLAQMQAAQDWRDTGMQQRRDKLTRSPELLMATLARGTPPASTPEHPQGSCGDVDAGAAGDAQSTPSQPQESHRSVDAGGA